MKSVVLENWACANDGEYLWTKMAIGKRQEKLETLTCIYIFTCCMNFFLPCSGLYMEGELETTEDWAFLARFCFLSDIGRLRFEVEYPKSFAVENLILYYDEEDQWPAVYPPDRAPLKTCEQKESVLLPENHQVINLTTNFVWSGCVLKSTEAGDERWENRYDDTEKYDCKSGRSFRSVRDRWWYVVVDNCDSQRGLVLRYKLTMTNGESFFRQHFSADQFGVTETDLLFAILYTIVLLIACTFAGITETNIMFAIIYFIIISITFAFSSILKSKQLYHTTYKLFMVAVILYFCCLISYLIFYFDYASTGTEHGGWKLFARILQAVSDAIFLLMLILMAKGYTITRGRISTSGSIKITILMGMYCLIYSVLFIYESVVFDPGEVLYLYESPAGFCLIVLRGLTWLWFIYAIFFTLKHYPEKATFYIPFFFAYTIWFLALPVMIMVATFIMPKWWREKAMNAIELTVAFVAHTGFLILTRPTAANQNFPYHVRTSQIGVMLEADGSFQNNVDAFSHHAYASTVLARDERQPNFDTLFTVGYDNDTKSADIKKNNNCYPDPFSYSEHKSKRAAGLIFKSLVRLCLDEDPPTWLEVGDFTNCETFRHFLLYSMCWENQTGFYSPIVETDLKSLLQYDKWHELLPLFSTANVEQIKCTSQRSRVRPSLKPSTSCVLV